MEYTPICIDCDNFKNGDKCKLFEKIPIEIKTRERECGGYTGGEYDLLTLAKND